MRKNYTQKRFSLQEKLEYFTKLLEQHRSEAWLESRIRYFEYRIQDLTAQLNSESNQDWNGNLDAEIARSKDMQKKKAQ